MIKSPLSLTSSAASRIACQDSALPLTRVSKNASRSRSSAERVRGKLAPLSNGRGKRRGAFGRVPWPVAAATEDKRETPSWEVDNDGDLALERWEDCVQPCGCQYQERKAIGIGPTIAATVLNLLDDPEVKVTPTRGLTRHYPGGSCS